MTATETAAATDPVRVLIVDDDALVRAGLTMMLDGAQGIIVVGQASDGADVGPAVDEHRPDVVLMDIRMPRVDGIAATRTLAARAAPPHVIVLTTYDSDDNLANALRAGASGFLLKDAAPTQIVLAIRQVVAGEPAFSPAVLRRMMTHVAGNAQSVQARAALDQLSTRERDVALAVAQGQTNGQIAAGLYMSVATVKAHVSHILTKLELGNRTQIAMLVHEADL